MHNRTELQTLLENILGSRNVYFQPPTGFFLKYPCIVYELTSIDTVYADNNGYKRDKSYQITLMDKNPEPDTVEKILSIEKCRFDRQFASDGINNFIFRIYY